MTENEDKERSFWFNIATNLPDLSKNFEGVEHLVDRFVGQYLPVLPRVSRREDVDHAWLTFWNYLVAPRTNRNPCSLSGQTADLLIAKFQNVLSGPS